jgi:hypothetical protein
VVTDRFWIKVLRKRNHSYRRPMIRRLNSVSTILCLLVFATTGVAQMSERAACVKVCAGSYFFRSSDDFTKYFSSSSAPCFGGELDFPLTRTLSLSTGMLYSSISNEVPYYTSGAYGSGYYSLVKREGEIILREYLWTVTPRLNVPLTTHTNLGVRIGPLIAVAHEVLRIDVLLSHDLWIFGGTAGFIVEQVFPNSQLVAFVEGELHYAQRENSRFVKYGGEYIGVGLGFNL